MPDEDRLSRARGLMERRDVAPAALLSPEISASWTRCLDNGLDPNRPPPLEMIEAAALGMAREEAGLARCLALAEMKALYHQIAGSNFLIAFASPSGVLLDIISDASFRTAARTASIRPGTLWTERRRGTNALGTCAQTGQAVTVHGPEHFFARDATLTCTAAPVFGPDGRLAGILDASSHCGSRQRHTRALVGMAATQIENGLFRQHHRDGLMLTFHSRAEYLRTLNAGLLALAPDGTVLGANQQARFLLQGLSALPGRHFDDLFRGRFAALVAAGSSGGHHRLEDRVGSAFVADLEGLAPPRRAAPSPPVRSAPALSAVPAPTLAPGFVAGDRAVVGALRRIEAAARRRLPILIRGETGTGKEQLARHAHRASGRGGAFVAVNCAALPDSLVEAEFFGHADGAFTGARRGGAPGLACEADGGTLFLDEIGDMKLSLQTILLRLLDDWTVRPVGGGRARQVDVLLIAATHAGLEQLVAAGRFRSDLFYRLNAVDVALPPLRARDDFPAIVRRLLAELQPGRAIAEDAIDLLAGQDWPGNVRQLRNMLTRLTLDEPDLEISPQISPEISPEISLGAVMLALGTPPGTPPGTSPAAAPSATLRGAIGARIAAAHRDTGGNISKTARQLGVSRNTVYRAMRRREMGRETGRAEQDR